MKDFAPEISADGTIDLVSLIGHRQTVNGTDTVERVFETFRETGVEFVAVIEGDRLLGMCSRHAIDSLLGGRYGFSLWARKPIAQHLAEEETRIAVTTPITAVLGEVFARHSETFYDDVLLVDEGERLLGLISTETLFKVQNALLGANISELERKEREIRQKNEQMESELRMAMELQQAMMPKTEPLVGSTAPGVVAGPRFDHRYVAASLVGGDFFHVVRLTDTSAGVLICDVMGHGVRSALITAMVRALIEGCRDETAVPGLLLTHLNAEFTRILRQTDTVLFATAFYCVLDTGRRELRYARAGHPYPFHMQRSAGVVAPLRCGQGTAGPALGLFDSARYGESSVPLEPGDWVLLFTDGIEEVADSAGVEFGVSGLSGVLQRNLDQPPSLVLDQLLTEVGRFANGAPFEDDVCLVAAETPA